MEEPKIIDVGEAKDIEWLKKEMEELKKVAFDDERLPALKLQENKITEIVVDFSKGFDSWKDQESNTTKKIIPVKSDGKDFVWWLNVRNPVYNQIIFFLISL